MFKLRKLSLLATSVFFFIAAKVLAAGPASLPNPLKTDDIRVVIGRIINYALGFVGAVALVMFIYGGFLYLVSGGESKRAEAGQKTLVWATIGLAIIFASYAIVNFVIGGLTAGTAQ